MTKSVLNVNGSQLGKGYSKSEGDQLVTSLFRKSTAQCRELGVGIYDLYLPPSSVHKSPDDAIFDLIQIVKAYYTKRHAAFVWKKDDVLVHKYHPKSPAVKQKTRYRVILSLEQAGYNDFENVFKYVLKTWAEVHGYKLKDVFRNRNMLASVEPHDYCIKRTDDVPAEITINHIASYLDPTVTPRIS